MAVNVSNPEDLRGASVVGSGGDKLGKIDEIYLTTRRPNRSGPR